MTPYLYEVVGIEQRFTSNEYFFEGPDDSGSITGFDRGCSIGVGAQVYVFKASEYQREVLLDVQTGRYCEKEGL
jgi:hypothetical protein